MEKTKGIVMRTSSKVTVIFTKKGDFLEIPTPKEPPVVGQTIEVDYSSSIIACSEHQCFFSLIHSEYGSSLGRSRY